MTAQFYDKTAKAHDVLILPVTQDKQLFADAKPLDQGASGLYSKILSSQDDFKASEHGSVKFVSIAHEDLPYASILLVACGKAELTDSYAYEELGAKACAALDDKVSSVACAFGSYSSVNAQKSEDAASFANGFALRSYRFTKYKTKADDKKDAPILSMICGDLVINAAKAYEKHKAVTGGVFAARDLVTEPANKLNPVTYAKMVKDMFKSTDVKVKILDDKKMAKMGMEAIVAVGKASETPSRMVIMEYNGLGKSSKTPTAAFVGKGVTFDTGGISIKPGGGMEDMKFDMAGSAAVVGAMKALADRGANVHIIGAIGLAENTLSDNAYRPSDVLTSYSGQTIEVINTDAEGRLVLADTLTYIQQEYKPKTVIDLATLTGAMLVALGHEYAGAYTTTDALYSDLDKASQHVHENVWRMPIDKEFDKQLASPIADMRNLATTRFGGSCTAAAFLHRFIDEDTEWAHLDIAGTAWRTSDRVFTPKGATGFGVRLLNEFARLRYET